MLARHKTHPRRELTSVPKGASIRNGRYNGRRDYRANTFHFRDSLAQIIALETSLNPLFESTNAFVHGAKFLVHSRHQFGGEGTQQRRRLGKQGRQVHSHLPELKGQNDAVLCQQAADLIAELRAAADRLYRIRCSACGSCCSIDF